MMKSPPLVEMICVRFCSHYKPGKNEELVCEGYTVVERLMRSNAQIAYERFGHLPDKSVQEMLVQTLCTRCDFHARDCDFIQDRTALPCGGFVLISQLLGCGTLTWDDIK